MGLRQNLLGGDLLKNLRIKLVERTKNATMRKLKDPRCEASKKVPYARGSFGSYERCANLATHEINDHFYCKRHAGELCLDFTMKQSKNQTLLNHIAKLLVSVQKLDILDHPEFDDPDAIFNDVIKNFIQLHEIFFDDRFGLDFGEVQRAPKKVVSNLQDISKKLLEISLEPLENLDNLKFLLASFESELWKIFRKGV